MYPILQMYTLFSTQCCVYQLTNGTLLYAVSYTHLDVYKRQVYVSDHSTVVKAEAVSRKK